MNPTHSTPAEQPDLWSILFGDQAEPETPTPPAPKAERQARRDFWRCPTCLSVWSTDDCPRTPHCSLCEIEAEHMGEVHRFRLRQMETYCPCDARCTNAIGPNCECSCGGTNHGKGLLLRWVDAGGIPTITPPDTFAAERRRDEYRQALAAARERIQWALSIMDRKRRGEYIQSYAELCRASDALAQLSRAKARRTHAGRIKALAALR